MKLIKETKQKIQAKRLVSVGDEIVYLPPVKLPAFHSRLETIPVYSHQSVVVKVNDKTFDVKDRFENVYRLYIEHDPFQVIKKA